MTDDTPLAADLRAMIADSGPIPVERYMALCLQHPLHGYYITRPAIGAAGDFTTAPEVSQMFGELLGLWCAQVWLDLGAPTPFCLLELGPGRGTLMADVLRATRHVPGFAEAARVTLVESSMRLRDMQRTTLGEAAGRVTWHESIDAVAPGPVIALANEFFDALPICQYQRDADQWFERCVGLDGNDKLTFARSVLPASLSIPGAKEGAVKEIGRAALIAMTELAKRIVRDGGALLVCDYGYGASGFGDTLQAVRDHHYADVLSAPGLCDLTAHVDFAALRAAAQRAGAAVHGPVPQGIFLERLGIMERAAALGRNATAAQRSDLQTALARLVEPQSSMARLFNCLTIMGQNARVPPGFEGNE